MTDSTTLTGAEPTGHRLDYDGPPEAAPAAYHSLPDALAAQLAAVKAAAAHIHEIATAIAARPAPDGATAIAREFDRLAVHTAAAALEIEATARQMSDPAREEAEAVAAERWTGFARAMEINFLLEQLVKLHRAPGTPALSQVEPPAPSAYRLQAG